MISWLRSQPICTHSGKFKKVIDLEQDLKMRQASLVRASLFVALILFAYFNELKAIGSDREEFEKYKEKFRKDYPDPEEDEMRFKLFMETRRRVAAKTSKAVHEVAGIELNEFADWTQLEREGLLGIPTRRYKLPRGFRRKSERS